MRLFNLTRYQKSHRDLSAESDRIKSSTLALAQEAGLVLPPGHAPLSAAEVVSRVIEVASDRAEASEARMSSAGLRLQVAQALTKQQLPQQSLLLPNSKEGPAAEEASHAILLHQCFRFRPPGASAQEMDVWTSTGSHQGCDGSIKGLIKALAVVAGSSLGVILCDSRAASLQILEDGGAGGRGSGGRVANASTKVRIWPLDAITTGPDRREKQRAAVKALGPGETS